MSGLSVTTAAYGTVELDYLTAALFSGVADRLGLDVDQGMLERIAERIMGLHGVPSDEYMAAYDAEVAALAQRYEAAEAPPVTIEVRGVTVEAHVANDGAVVVQIDTPDETDDHETMRVYMNEARAAGWRPA